MGPQGQPQSAIPQVRGYKEHAAGEAKAADEHNAGRDKERYCKREGIDLGEYAIEYKLEKTVPAENKEIAAGYFLQALEADYFEMHNKLQDKNIISEKMTIRERG